jgi:short-chain fatty acids transporter
MSALSQFFTKLSRRYLPDAFIFALLLTLVVFVAGLGIGKSPIQMIDYWGKGFWNLMTFSMQMALVLITGFTLAKTSMVNKLLKKIASLANNQTQAILLVTLVSSMSCFINWGFGLIVSALFAIEVSRQIKEVNFGLILASAYSGFLVWHGGLSGSIPLKLTSPSANIQKILNTQNIAFNETVYSSINIVLLLGTIVVLLVANVLMGKDKSEVKEFFYDHEVPETQFSTEDTFASKIENAIWLNGSICLAGFIYIGSHFYRGGGFTLNIMIFLFLILAMTFNVTPKRFLNSFNNSVKDSSGIILQFPFYAGLMGMMSSSGLATQLSQFFVSISSEKTFLFFTYLSAGLVNFFVPSGGGQWAIQGPIILPAASELGVDMAKTSMAIAWGDAWSNMVQPFWALPLLSVGRIDLKDMMGYCVIIFIASGLFSSLVFLTMY